MADQERRKAPLPVREPGTALRHLLRIGAIPRRHPALQQDDTRRLFPYQDYGCDRDETPAW